MADTNDEIFDENDNSPGYEPEDCECRKEVEESGIEYTQDFHASEDGRYWICDHCGRHQ